MNKLDELTMEMIAFDHGDAKRIQHFLKVHRFAQMIAAQEIDDEHLRFVTESAAVLHDIGIHPAEEKYGSCEGKLQEKEGPIYARPMLERLGYEAADIDRICYLIGHHHTYSSIDGLDYQILVEADFLVNLFEDGSSIETVRTTEQRIFRTAMGKRLLEEMFC